jgi:MoaA/NifB/PqqE/SkfB family radical SAM enzyme
MPAIIWRSIGNTTHFLNCINGQIVSVEVNSVEAERIINRSADYEFDYEAENVFKNIRGQYNSRLCRKNLIKLGLVFNFPTIVNIELSRRCSLRCIHCYIGNKNLSSSEPGFLEQMNKSDIDGFFDELKDLGVFLVVITGGEPFISKSLWSLLRIGTEKGFLIEIFSNLQHLPKWFLINTYGNFRIGRIQTSVYSSVPKIHDDVTKSDGSFKRNFKNIHLLIKKGYFVEVATPLMKKNFTSWESTKLFFQKKKIAQNFSWPIANEYYSHVKKSRLNISGKNLRDFTRKNYNFISETHSDNPNEYICEAGKAIFAISAAGDVFPCSQMPLSVGNIMFKKKIKEIVYGKNMLKTGSLKWKDILAKKVFNFCPGINYTDAKNVLTQPKHMLNAVKAVFIKQKGGE